MPVKFQEAQDNSSSRLMTIEITNLGVHAQVSPTNRPLLVSLTTVCRPSAITFRPLNRFMPYSTTAIFKPVETKRKALVQNVHPRSLRLSTTPAAERRANLELGPHSTFTVHGHPYKHKGCTHASRDLVCLQ